MLKIFIFIVFVDMLYKNCQERCESNRNQLQIGKNVESGAERTNQMCKLRYNGEEEGVWSCGQHLHQGYTYKIYSRL